MCELPHSRLGCVSSPVCPHTLGPVEGFGPIYDDGTKPLPCSALLLWSANLDLDLVSNPPQKGPPCKSTLTSPHDIRHDICFSLDREEVCIK